MTHTCPQRPAHGNSSAPRSSLLVFSPRELAHLPVHGGEPRHLLVSPARRRTSRLRPLRPPDHRRPGRTRRLRPRVDHRARRLDRRRRGQPGSDTGAPAREGIRHAEHEQHARAGPLGHPELFGADVARDLNCEHYRPLSRAPPPGELLTPTRLAAIPPNVPGVDAAKQTPDRAASVMFLAYRPRPA